MFLAIPTSDRCGEGLLHDCVFPGLRTDLPRSQDRGIGNRAIMYLAGCLLYLWRTIKYEEVYLNDYQSPREARERLRDYLRFYNEQRIHQSGLWRFSRPWRILEKILDIVARAERISRSMPEDDTRVLVIRRLAEDACESHVHG